MESNQYQALMRGLLDLRAIGPNWVRVRFLSGQRTRGFSQPREIGGAAQTEGSAGRNRGPIK